MTRPRTIDVERHQLLDVVWHDEWGLGVVLEVEHGPATIRTGDGAGLSIEISNEDFARAANDELPPDRVVGFFVASGVKEKWLGSLPVVEDPLEALGLAMTGAPRKVVTFLEATAAHHAQGLRAVRLGRAMPGPSL